jgi:hypothetical protein
MSPLLGLVDHGKQDHGGEHDRKAGNPQPRRGQPQGRGEALSPSNSSRTTSGTAPWYRPRKVTTPMATS